VSLTTRIDSAIHDARPSWHNPRILGILLLVFLGGASTGVMAIRMGWFSAAKQAPAALNVWREQDKVLYLANLKRELDLTPEQSAKIEAALDDLVMFYQNLQTQMDDLRAQGKGRILEVLTEEQRKKFEKRMDKFRTPAR
jgi:Spy/CpxP family protein refolding chaperone